MPKVTGKLTDFGFDVLAGHNPRLLFKHNTPGVAGASIMPTRPVAAVPEYNGYFEADLTASARIAPAGYYTVTIQWTDLPGRTVYSEEFPGRLYVPAEGGVLADILRVPANPGLVWTGTEPPANPSPGTWWLGDDGLLQEWDGQGWTFKQNTRGPAGYNATGAAEDDAAIARFIGEAAGATLTGAALTKLRGQLVKSVMDFGAKGDGKTDDTAAIARAVAALPAAGGVLLFPAGNYLHRGVKIDGKSRFEMRGPGVLIAATSFITPYVLLSNCSDFTISGLSSRHENPTARRPTAGRAFTLTDCTRFTVTGCEAAYCEGVGIMAIRSSYGRITDNMVHHTWADGIGVYNASQHITITGNTCTETGDDAIAVVSTPGEAFICHDITITGNTSHHSLSRGMVVAGGDRVTISGNTVIDPRNSGIWVGRDAGNNCNGCTGVTVTGNTIRGANSYGAFTDYPGIDVVSGEIAHAVHDVIVANNVVIESRLWGIRVGAGKPGTSRVQITGNTVTTAGASGVFVQNVQDISISGNMLTDTRHGAILAVDTLNGAVSITNNLVRDPCKDTGQTVGINIPTTTAGAFGRVSGNTVIDTTGHMVQAIQTGPRLSLSDNYIGTKPAAGGAETMHRINSTLLVAGATETSGTGGGVGVLAQRNAKTPPTGNPFDGGVTFIEAGALKYKGSNGTVTTLAPA